MALRHRQILAEEPKKKKKNKANLTDR